MRSDPAAVQAEVLLATLFPVVLTIGILLIPVVPDYSDDLAASKAAENSLRWGLGHLIAASAFGLGAASTSALAGLIAAAGKRILSLSAYVSCGLGAALHAAGLGADGIGPLALIAAESDAGLFFAGSAAWVPPLFIAGSVLWITGLLILTAGLRAIGVLSRAQSVPVAAGILVFGVCEAVPSGWGLHGVAGSACLVFWAFALAVKSHTMSRN